MRIAIAEIGQETDTFSPLDTDLELFKSHGLFVGDEIPEMIKSEGMFGPSSTSQSSKRNLMSYSQSYVPGPVQEAGSPMRRWNTSKKPSSKA
ncbi:MAG: M81 family metallopeptidase [Candidatus Latescibacterota bacterium]